MRKDTKTIGEVAKLLGTTVKTVRYYDDIALLKPSSHSEGGHRLYTPEDISRLRLITTLRYLDFGIDEIRQVMAGEIQLTTALDWQIEALETQVSTLTNMISILRQAKEHYSAGTSLHYMNELVDSLSMNADKRNRFISSKIEEIQALGQLPAEWQDTFLYLFNKYIINEVKVTAGQTVAWNELQALMNDTHYLEDLVRYELAFFNMVRHPRVPAAAWIRTLENIRVRVEAALQQRLSADSAVVQTIVEDFVMMYANQEQFHDKAAFFQQYAQSMPHAPTERMERFNKLCLLLNPKWDVIVRGNALLMQGLQWKLRQEDPHSAPC
ncbi:MerR family transcriptional regulator [Paenibacillus lutimineralis]|uniref:MerR family transcriptional regulator n=1 Tax=Paenibacillus lutimineralis TaxID=2707005 RepID=A0A3S9UZ39_9BACL|nr:MerR family transcriptional regulator [Paenibacillus lutimineralis]AZS15531.1 MerR family transcriptional regulator [Paenibacillus lutimineralis]